MNITSELILSELKKKGSSLRPNQGKLSLPIIDRICKKMQHDLKFNPIHVSSDNLIINGHHRYISSILSGYKIEEVPNYPEPSVLNEFDWNTVEFAEDDWDSPSKIKMLNELDAKYNGMKVGDIEEILSAKA